MPFTLTMYEADEVPKRCRQLGHAYEKPRFMDRYECTRCDLKAWSFTGHDEERQIVAYNGPLLERACPGQKET